MSVPPAVRLSASLKNTGKASGTRRTALLFGISMKHTGLALVLAGEVLTQQSRVLMMIMLATLTQHIVAAVADRILQEQQLPTDC